MNQNLIQSLMNYDKDTGIVTNRYGKIISKVSKSGYLRISTNGKTYQLHNLIWLYAYGMFPSGVIDHINQNKIDNRLVNLRDVSRLDNSKNRPKTKHNKSGVTGVSWKTKSEKWVAQISVDGTIIHLGLFEKFSEAVDARKLAEVAYGFHKNHGKEVCY